MAAKPGRRFWERPWWPRARLVAQLLVTACLCVWLARSVAWADVRDAIAGANPGFVLASALLYYAGVLLSCWKWQLLLSAEMLTPPLQRMVRWYLIGAFGSNFLPTDIGGDLGRGVMAGQYTGRPMAVARSILAERLTGLAMMLVLAWLALGLLMGRPDLALLLAGAAALCVLGAAWLRAGVAGRLPARARALLGTVADAWRVYGGQRGRLALVLVISLVFQVLSGVGVWLNFRAVGVQLPLGATVLGTAVAGVVGLAPVAINGWGVREAIYVTLFAPLGATPGGIVAGALFARALQFVLSLAGAAALALERHGERKAT